MDWNLPASVALVGVPSCLGLGECVDAQVGSALPWDGLDGAEARLRKLVRRMHSTLIRLLIKAPSE